MEILPRSLETIVSFLKQTAAEGCKGYPKTKRMLPFGRRKTFYSSRNLLYQAQ